MKRMKMYFIAAALTLATIGVFAGKSNFFSDASVYGYNHFVGGIEFFTNALISSAFSGISTGELPATISDPNSSGSAFSLYYAANGNIYWLYPVLF